MQPQEEAMEVHMKQVPEHIFYLMRSSSWDMDTRQLRIKRKDKINKSLPLSLKYNLERLSLEACRRLMIRPLFTERQSINVVTENTTVNWSQQMQYLETMCQPRSIDTAIIYWPCISIELKNWMISSIIIHLLHTACIQIISFYVLQVILTIITTTTPLDPRLGPPPRRVLSSISVIFCQPLSILVTFGQPWSILVIFWSALVNQRRSDA